MTPDGLLKEWSGEGIKGFKIPSIEGL